jgi:hypothetical protein
VSQALKPKEGRFLPAAAALGGLLFLAPDGHYAAEHDVLQLQTSLLALKQQQGYITCQSKPDVSSLLCRGLLQHIYHVQYAAFKKSWQLART